MGLLEIQPLGLPFGQQEDREGTKETTHFLGSFLGGYLCCLLTFAHPAALEARLWALSGI